jgi:hypothetical protein
MNKSSMLHIRLFLAFIYFWHLFSSHQFYLSFLSASKYSQVPSLVSWAKGQKVKLWLWAKWQKIVALLNLPRHQFIHSYTVQTNKLRFYLADEQ